MSAQGPFLIVWTLVFFTAGCSRSVGMVAEGRSNSCSSDSDCLGEGSLCDLENGICVSRVGGEFNLLFEVTPVGSGNGVKRPPQYFVYSGRTDGRGEQTFLLEQTVWIEGVVEWPEPEAGFCLRKMVGGNCIVDARLELSAEGPFPETLRATVVTHTGMRSEGLVTGDEVDFSIEAVPGSYSLWVFPEPPFDSYLPPIQVFSRKEITDDIFERVTYPSISTMRVVDGTIWREDGSTVTGILVWAVDSVSGGRISSIARFEPEGDLEPGGNVAGNFRLYMLPESYGGQTTFYVAIASSDATPHVPTMRFGPYDFTTLDEMDGVPDAYANFNLSAATRLTLPLIGVRVNYMASVEGLKEDGTQEPIEGVRVRFYTEDMEGDGVSGSYEVFALTDQEGRIRATASDPWGVWLFRGDYVVTLYPPLDTPYEAAEVFSVRVAYQEGGRAQMGQTFQLQRKKMVSGVILIGSSGEPAGRVIVEAYPTAPVAREAVPRFNSAQSGDDGTFSLLLDRGKYDLLFVPEPLSNFPWFWQTNVTLEHDDAYVTARVPDPVAFIGSVLDADGMPVGDAEVKVYTILFPPDPMEPPRVRRAGKVTSRDDGSFLALIAP